MSSAMPNDNPIHALLNGNGDGERRARCVRGVRFVTKQLESETLRTFERELGRFLNRHIPPEATKKQQPEQG